MCLPFASMRLFHQASLNVWKLFLSSLRRLSSTSQVGSVELLPASGETDERSNTGDGDRHGEDNPETLHVAVENERKLLGSEDVADLRCASKDEVAEGDVGGPGSDVLDHGVEEGRLRTGDNEGTANALSDYEVC